MKQNRFTPSDGTELCMYQVSTLQALAMGYTKAVVTVEELLRHGDTGLGTFEGVDGELIVPGCRCRSTRKLCPKWENLRKRTQNFGS